MTIDNILKRAQQCKNRKAKWVWYELYKSDIRRAARTPREYQMAIQRLKEMLKV
jgi:hypothetical protein